MQTTEKRQSEILNDILLKCQSDDSFRQRVIENPTQILIDAGIEIPDGVEIKVLENTDKLKHIILPAKHDELSDDQLDSVAGGTSVVHLNIWI